MITLTYLLIALAIRRWFIKKDTPRGDKILYSLDVTAAAKYIGINPSVLRQYVTALREPKQAQIDKIRAGLNKLANDLGSGLLIEKPVVSYI